MGRVSAGDCRASLFDASALVKVFSNEPGTDIVRPYFDSETTKYTTPFCFYEALNVLKGKWLYKKQLTKDEYLNAAYRLSVWFGASSQKIRDIEFVELMKFAKLKNLVESTSLDLSDCFQILSIKDGYFSPLIKNSATILVTADKQLSIVAMGEGLKVWYFMEGPVPSTDGTAMS